MILICFRLSGISLKKKNEFGDKLRAEMWVLNLLLLRIYFIKKHSEFSEFFRGYTSQHYDWHPLVRIARRNAKKKAHAAAMKDLNRYISDIDSRFNEICHENSKLKQENLSLISTIKIIKEHDRND